MDQYTQRSQQEIRDELARRNLLQQPPFVNERERKWLTNDAFFWRGALGGAIGCCVYLIYLGFRYWTSYAFALSIWYSPIWIIEGGVIGLIIGLVFWSLYRNTGRKPGTLSRILIGACFTYIAVWGFSVFTEEGVTAPFGSWRTFTLGVVFSLTVGGLSGAMARPRRRKEEPGESGLH